MFVFAYIHHTSWFYLSSSGSHFNSTRALRFRAPWTASPKKCGVSMMLCAFTKHAAIFGSLWLQHRIIPKRDLYGCHSHPWKDNRSNCYCENVRKMKNCSTRNMRKIFCSKENLGWPPRGNTLRLTRVVWKSTQSSAVVCLNKESSLRVRVQYKREVLTIRVLWRLSSGKEKKRSLACRRHL